MSMRTAEAGDVLWTPSGDLLTTTRIGAFVAWVAEHRGVVLGDRAQLWDWSVTDLAGFWSAVWEFFRVVDHGTPRPAGTAVLADDSMPGARWFEGSLVNYAEHALRTASDPARADEPAVLGRSQTRPDTELTWRELADQVASARAALAEIGVRRGDRVVGYLPNVPEAIVAHLATASLGAVWATCATEFGSRSVLDRFGQLDPVVLIVAGGYQYGAKAIDRRDQVAEIIAGLPTVRHVLDIEYGPWRVERATSWSAALAGHPGADLDFEPMAFADPLVVLFSSGTTGRPKAIVHGHGGILLEHLKNHGLSWDLGPGDRLLWFTTTAWMMWNAQVSTLLVGASLVTIDGDPAHPDLGWQWRLAAETQATLMGAAPGFVMACRAAGVEPRDLDLDIKMVGSAGSPMPIEGYLWIRDQLGPDVQLNVGSGGTDVCSGLLQGDPWLPVVAGRISGPALGVAARAFDGAGHEVIGEPGELVITAPMPSMPVGIWGDDDGTLLHAAYFDTYPGVWRHGDWVVFEPDGSCVVTGRSDATLNRGGVRLGTAELYRVVEELDGVEDSLVVHLEDDAGGNGELLLFVRLVDTVELDDDLRRLIARTLRTALSPRHVPDQVIAVPVVPRNLTGKKLEVPAKRILQGAALESVAGRDALADPTSLDAFVELARERVQ